MNEMEIMIHEFWHDVSMMFVWDWFTEFNMMSWLWSGYEIWRDSWKMNDVPWHGIGMMYDSIFMALGRMSCG